MNKAEQCGHNAIWPELLWLGMSIFAQCCCPAGLCQPAWSLPEEVQCNTPIAIRSMAIQGHTVYPVPTGIIARTSLVFCLRRIKSLESAIEGTLQEM